MLQAITRRLRRGKRGISTVIVVMLSLVLMVIIVGNVVLWSYQMNQLDWEKMREDVAIVNATSVRDGGTLFTFKNEGSLTLHLVSLWINNSTQHQRYNINIFINSGDTASYTYSNVTLPDKPYNVKVITERGNTAVFASD